MFVLDLQRELHVPPPVAFALVSDPERMNWWSEARVERVLAGDGGLDSGTGALRRVRPKVAGRELVLEEIVERAEPPSVFEYRVISGAGVRKHRGTITITPSSEGSHLHWHVEAILTPPPLEWIACAALRPKLDRSLDAMARVAGELAPRRDLPGLPPLRALDEETEARALMSEAEACLEAQRARADALLVAGDDRGWFARAYQHVTEGELVACAARRFEHPAWVLRLVCAFHALWEENLAIRLGEREGEVEPHWARGHRAAERAGRGGASTFLRALRSIHAGMRAHIEDDLPRAIAKVHLTSYAGRADLARFRADYLRMSDVFLDASSKLAAVLPRDGWTWKARVIHGATPDALRAVTIEKHFYPIAERRREAFERAIGLARVFGSAA